MYRQVLLHVTDPQTQLCKSFLSAEVPEETRNPALPMQQITSFPDFLSSPNEQRKPMRERLGTKLNPQRLHHERLAWASYVSAMEAGSSLYLTNKEA